MRRAALLAGLGLCACDAFAQGFGEAMAFAALVAAALFVAAGTLYAVLWGRLVRGLVRGRGSPAASEASAGSEGAAPRVVRTEGWSLLVLVGLHGLLVGLASEFEYGQGDAAGVLLWLGVLPVGGLVAAGVRAARRGRSLLLALAAVPAVVWVRLVTDAWLTRELSELPGRVQQVTSAGHTCARLSTGQVACIGANWDGQRGDGTEHEREGPTFVRGLGDAVDVVVAYHLGCARRAAGPVVCWGRGEEMPAPEDFRVPWELPEGGDVATIVASGGQIVTLSRGGVLRGWPNALPHGLARASRLAGDDDFGGAWFCAFDEELLCWTPQRLDKVVRLAIPAPTTIAVDAGADVVCVGDAGGTVRCFALDGGVERRVEVPGLRQLWALDDSGTFCGGGERTICWRGPQGPTWSPAELEGAERVFAGGGLICGERGEDQRCAVVDRSEAPGAKLLEYDRQP